MNDTTRTITYAAVALIAVLIAWEPWNSVEDVQQSAAGDKLFADFKDPAAAKSLEIVRFDEASGEIEPFKVAQVGGVWSIPSHQNYPADAVSHLAEAATSVMDLEILGVASNNPGDQEEYGVKDPQSKDVRAGAVGVGTRVIMRDDKDKVLADLIIGKADKDRPDLRFVRDARHDQIYRVAVKTSKLSTKFGDWIEKDLLKLNAFDVRGVELNDYSANPKMVLNNGRPQMSFNAKMRGKIRLGYNDEKSEWKLLELTEFAGNEPKEAKLAEDEELNAEKLNGLRTALDDLQIVDVQKKPKGLSTDLRVAESFYQDESAVESLFTRGFYPFQAGDKDEVALLSSEGEVVCHMKDGVEYVLRFGSLTGTSEKAEEGAAADKKKGEAAKLNRFLLVMAQLNKDEIEKPKLDALPGEDAAADSDEKPDQPPADAAKPETTEPGASKDNPDTDPAPATGAEESNVEEGDSKAGGGAALDSKMLSQFASADAPAPKSVDPFTKRSDAGAKESPAKGKTSNGKAVADPKKPVSEPAKPAAKDDKTAKSNTEPKNDKTAADAKPEPPKVDQPKDEKTKAAEAASRKAIEKENRRKQDEYKDKVKKAEEHVSELNKRFADWYFVISDDVYRKIHLGRADVIKKKEKAAGKGDNINDLKELESGLKK